MTTPWREPGLYWHVHHDVLAEWCYDYEERAQYIRTQKPQDERELRLRLFQPVQGQLAAEWDKARAELDKAKAEWDKAWAEWDKAWAELGKARAELGKARAELGKARAELDKAETEWGKAWADHCYPDFTQKAEAARQARKEHQP